MSKLKLKYGIGIVSAVAAFVGVADLSVPRALAVDVMGTPVSDLGTQRAKIEFEIQKQECDTLKNSQPQAYEPCLQKAQSTRDSLLTQAGSAPAGQGSQGFGSNQSQQQSSRQEEKGPIDKMTSAVKETVAEVKEFFGSDQGRQGQQQGQGFAQGQPSQQGFGAGSGQQGQNPAQWQQSGQGFAQGQPSQQGLGTGGQQPQGQSMGQGQQGGVTQGQPLQQGFEGRHMQGQGSVQGGQGQQLQSGQGSFQGGQQPQGQSGPGSFQGGQPQGQSGPGSFQAGNYGQQPQGQSGQQGTGGTQQFQSGGTQEEEHMDSVEYYKVLAHQQYGTLKQECNALKNDPNVYEQCQQHAKSVRDKIAGMGKEGADATQRSNQRGG